MNSIKEAFAQVRAEETLKEKTLASVEERLRLRRQPALRRNRRWIAAACVLALCLCLGGYRLYFTPTSVVSIDVNPSLELAVNRFDQVVAVEGRNADGERLAASVNVRFMDCRQAVETILDSQAVAPYLTEDAVVSIAVIGEEGTQRQRLLSGVQACTAGQENTYCAAAGWEEVEAAHETGLSYGKYMAYLMVQALDPEVTPEQVGQMSMREIRELLAQLSGQDSSAPGWAGGHGQGHGWGG